MRAKLMTRQETSNSTRRNSIHNGLRTQLPGLRTVLHLSFGAAIVLSTTASIAFAQTDAAVETAPASTAAAAPEAASSSGAATTPSANPASGAKIVTFDQVRPTFRKHCGACHGEQQQRGDLDLSTKASVMAGSSSGVVAVPGKPEESLLYVLTAHLDDPKMPPGAPRIPQRELDLIKNWIAHGMRERVEDEVAITTSSASDEGPAGGMAGPAETGVTGSDNTGNKLSELQSGNTEPAVVDAGFVGVRPAHHATPVTALAASPTSPLLAMSGNKQVVFSESPAAGFVKAVEFPEGDVFSLKFTPDGKTLLAAGGVGGASGRVVGFDLATGKRRFTLGDESDIVLATDLSPDGNLIAVGGPSRKVRVLNVADGKIVASVTRHTDWILSLAFSPDGLLLASSDRFGAVYVAEATSGKSFMEFRGHTGAVTQLKWHSTGDRLLSAGLDGTLRHWNLHTSSEESRVDAAVGGILSVAGHPEKRLFVGGRAKKVTSVSNAPGSVIVEWKFADEVTAVALSHDEKTLFAAEATGRVLALPIVADQLAAGSTTGPVAASTDGSIALQLPIKPAERVLAVVSAKLKPAIKLPETTLVATASVAETMKAAEVPTDRTPAQTTSAASPTTTVVAATGTGLSTSPFGSHSVADLEMSLAAAQQAATLSHEEWQSATTANASAADALRLAQETAAQLQRSHDALSAVVSAREAAAKRQAMMVSAIAAELQRRKSPPSSGAESAPAVTETINKPAAAISSAKPTAPQEPTAKGPATKTANESRQALLKKGRELRDQLVAASAAAPNDAALKSAADAAIDMCEKLAKGAAPITPDQTRIADADGRADVTPSSRN